MRPPPPRPASSLPAALPVALTVLTLLSGCGEATGPSLDPVVRDSSGILVHEFPAAAMKHPAPFSLPESPAVRIGVVEGAPEYQWNRPVAAGRLPDGGFAVLEQSPAELRVFDPAGQFLRRIATEGDGPGELRAPAGLIVLPGDTFLVWDPGPGRLSWFSKEGMLERELTLREPGGIRSIRRMALSPSGVAVALGPTTPEEDRANQGRVREIWQAVAIAADGEPGPPLGMIPGTERAIQIQRSTSGEIVSVNVQGRWWWGEGFAWGSRRGFWTADQLALEARSFDLDRGLVRIVRVMAEDRPFTNALIDSLHRVELDRVDDPDIRELWRADFEAREYPQDVPPVAAVFGDAAHRIWIGLTEPPPERLSSGELPAVRRWVVFEEGPSEAGEHADPLQLIGVLTLPARSHPLWADSEGVLLVRSEADTDVAFIEWYPYVDGPEVPNP